MQDGIVSVSPELGIAAFEELLTAEEISGAPVVGPNGEVMGIASKTDLVRFLTDQAGIGDFPGLQPELTVEDIMTREVVVIAPEASVQEVARMMLDGHLHRVVVADDEKMLGIITTFDLVRLVAEG
jgi:CBS domain-containing protein